MPSPITVSVAGSVPRHSNNVGAPASMIATFRENKNAHAVALGHMTSAKKAKAAQENGKKGGAPSK